MHLHRWTYPALLAAALTTVRPPLALAAAPTPAPAIPESSPAPDPGPPPDGSSGNVDQAATYLLGRGNKAYREGRFADAVRDYRGAFALKQGYDIAGDLAMAELAVGKMSDAAGHLAFSLRAFPLTGPTKQREEMEKELEKAKAVVGSIHVDVGDVGDAEVFVDGREINAAERPDDVFVEPGEHTIEARHIGRLPASKRVRVEKGQHVVVTLALALRPNEGEGPAVEVAKPRSKVPLVVLGSVAVAGLGAGIALLASSAGKQSTADQLRSDITASHGSCTGPVDGRCAALRSAVDASYVSRTIGIVSLSIAGAAAAGALTYALWPTATHKKATGLRAAPFFGLNHGGLWVSASF